MRRELTLKQLVNGFWQLVEVCLVDGFEVSEEQAERECAEWRTEVNRGWDVKRWDRLHIIYHDEPLNVAFSIAVRVGAAQEGQNPEAVVRQNGLNYREVRERVLSGQSLAKERLSTAS